MSRLALREPFTNTSEWAVLVNTHLGGGISAASRARVKRAVLEALEEVLGAGSRHRGEGRAHAAFVGALEDRRPAVSVRRRGTRGMAVREPTFRPPWHPGDVTFRADLGYATLERSSAHGVRGGSRQWHMHIEVRFSWTVHALRFPAFGPTPRRAEQRRILLSHFVGLEIANAGPRLRAAIAWRLRGLMGGAEPWVAFQKGAPTAEYAEKEENAEAAAW